MTEAPFRTVRLGPRETVATRNADGSWLLRSPHPLGEYARNLTGRLAHWAEAAPDRVLVARRGADGNWRRLTYAETWDKVRRIGQALLRRGLSPERPVAILSENGIEHLLLGLAAMHVGIPYSPISPAYSLVSTDFGKLRYTLGLLTPGLVFAASGEKYARAIAASVASGAELVIVADPLPDGASTPFDALLEAQPTDAVDAAHARVGPDTVGKILFTSGSTGSPKGVVNTQRMMCSNVAMIRAALPFIADGPPVIVDWLPWNHTFGGNHNTNLILDAGGTFYIDDGKPTPAGIAETVRNLREIAPTVFFNVPRGYEELIPHLRREPALRNTFFSRLSMLFYAGAGLSQPVWNALEELAVEACGERIMIITGLGATETAPSAMFANWPGGRSGLLGLPIPGVELKLVPRLGKLEARFRGPNVTPGYWRQPELNARIFDEDGFYRIGDALKFADPAHPGAGLLFDGRMSEDFKLSTGTWVSVGAIRESAIREGAPLVQDVVVAGHDRDFVAVILLPRLEDCRRLAGLGADASQSAVVGHPAVVEAIQRLIDRLARASTGSASRIERALVADFAPSLDLGEITDKGSINQGAVLAHRARLVDALYAERPGERIVCARSAESMASR